MFPLTILPNSTFYSPDSSPEDSTIKRPPGDLLDTFSIYFYRYVNNYGVIFSGMMPCDFFTFFKLFNVLYFYDVYKYLSHVLKYYKLFRLWMNHCLFSQSPIKDIFHLK